MTEKEGRWIGSRFVEEEYGTKNKIRRRNRLGNNEKQPDE